MNFSEALELLKEGKKIRRKTWSERSYLTILHGIIKFVESNVLGYSEINLSSNNIVADDWEVVDE